ncbi:MAG: DNA-directed RNA polymerase subunit alpha [Candidatus Omnitrophota bacterium]|nr:DNA-directed RNA polymerase subunit alpha [Candidatus Omnitrophota bacterium]
MGVRWRNFELPKVLECDKTKLTATYGKFIAEPFEKGYGVTIGNSLRRVLISSIEGTAVTNVKINGVLHEFSIIPGVVEDMTQIILNIKGLVLRSHSRTPKTIKINVDKKGEITAKDIQTDATVEVLNNDLHIATLSEKTKFNVEMEVAKGRGYLPAESNKKENQPIGIIPIDSIFSPVRKVNYHVENTRVGRLTDYERLILEVWTDSSLSPEEALLYGSNILQKHLEVFVEYGKLPEEEEVEEKEEEKEFYEVLRKPISELELSVRSANCLREARIKTIGELVQKSEYQMLKYRNFGKKSLGEILEILKRMDLSLGIKVDKERL